MAAPVNSSFAQPHWNSSRVQHVKFRWFYISDTKYCFIKLYTKCTANLSLVSHSAKTCMRFFMSQKLKRWQIRTGEQRVNASKHFPVQLFQYWMPLNCVATTLQSISLVTQNAFAHEISFSIVFVFEIPSQKMYFSVSTLTWKNVM